MIVFDKNHSVLAQSQTHLISEQPNATLLVGNVVGECMSSGRV